MQINCSDVLFQFSELRGTVKLRVGKGHRCPGAATETNRRSSNHQNLGLEFAILKRGFRIEHLTEIDVWHLTAASAEREREQKRCARRKLHLLCPLTGQFPAAKAHSPQKDFSAPK